MMTIKNLFTFNLEQGDSACLARREAFDFPTSAGNESHIR